MGTVAPLAEADHDVELAANLFVCEERRRGPWVAARVISGAAEDLSACIYIDAAWHPSPLPARHPLRNIRGTRLRLYAHPVAECDDPLVVHGLRFIPERSGRYLPRDGRQRMRMTELRTQRIARLLLAEDGRERERIGAHHHPINLLRSQFVQGKEPGEGGQ